MGDLRMYEKVLCRKAVLIKVPKGGQNMRYAPPHNFNLNGEAVNVAGHWRNGFKIPGWDTVLNRLFFGINEADVGNWIVAKVEVKRKTTQDGREFIFLDICKQKNGVQPTHTIKYLPRKEGGNNGITIAGTDWKIYFPKYVKKPVPAM